MKRWVGVLLILIIGLSACDVQNVDSGDDQSYVELNLYMIGNEPEDTEKVYTELNKLAVSELGIKVIVHFISFSELEQKYDQILSSGVAVDLIYTSDWCFYDSQARKGAFYEITMDDVAEYMPLTYESQPEETFRQAMIDDKMYMIPNYQEEFADYKVVLIRGDLRKKYGLEPLETMDDLYAYYEAVSEDETMTMLPYSPRTDNKELAYIGFWQSNNLVRVITDNKASSFAIRYDEKGNTDYELVNILKLPEYLDYLKMMRAWQQEGFWASNAIAGGRSAQEAFESGEAASLIWNIGTLNLSAIKVNKNHPEWEPEIYDLTEDAPKIIAKYTNNGMAIARKSQNYALSLQLLDKLKNDERYWNLTWLGIEGEHWKAVGTSSYEVLEAGSRFPYAEASCWGWGNKPFQRNAKETPSESNALIEKWTAELMVPKTHFFRFDDAGVRDESTEILEILSKYQPILELGMVEDVEGTYKMMMNELEAAGWNEYEAVFRRQYEAKVLE